MADPFPLFGSQNQFLVGLQQRDEEEEQPRNLLQRIFAPFEAPQQFLFSATQEVAEDGFQVGDLGRAALHGFRYGNPFSNEPAIDPDEIRRLFGGREDDSGIVKFSSNLAISLLYDPLLLTGVLGKLGKAGQVVDTLANPAGFLLGRGATTVGRAVSPAAQRLANATLGEERAERWSTIFQQYFVNRRAGLPEEMQAEVQRFEQAVNGWRVEGYKVLKQAENLGGPPTQRLMAEALEDESAFLARKEGRNLARYDRELERLGVSPDLFWETYDRARKLDDEIGMALVRSGVLNTEQFDEMRGRHLRRMFLATERPQDYIDRVEALAIPESERLSLGAFRSRLNSLRATLDQEIFGSNAGPNQFLFDPAERFGVAGSRYFQDGDRTRFNVAAFTSDLDTWLRKNSDSSAADVFSHIQREMLPDTRLPPMFWEEIGNYLNGSMVKIEGSEEWANKLRSWAHTPGFNWMAFRERLEVVADRQLIPVEIRQALGEIEEFGPRIASQASEAGRLVETRQFFDNIAGVTRDETGNIIEKRGTRLAAHDPGELQGPAVQLRGEHLGELDGMWVKPSVARFLQHMQGVGEVANPSRKLWQQVGDWARAGTGIFKVFKTVMDPATHVRNFVGNMVLADMMGTNMFKLGNFSTAFQELRHYGKTGEVGRYLRLAEESGVNMFQHTFSRAELQDYARALGEEKLVREGVWGAFDRIYNVIVNRTGRYQDRMSEAFEFEEQFMKLVVFIDRYDSMASKAVKRGNPLTPDVQRSIARQAGEMAERALFNYADVPIAVDFVRQYGVVPFATFPFKAAPYFARTLIEHPHRILKYDRTVDQLNDTMAGSPEDAAEQIAALPEHMRKRLVVQAPWQDEQGRTQYLDLSYFLPWFAIQDIAESAAAPFREGDQVLPREGMFSPPVATIADAMRHNKDGLGRPIVTPDMNAAQKAEAVGRFFWQMLMPGVIPGSARASSVGRAMLASATVSPEPQPWMHALGHYSAAGGVRNSVLPRPGFTPTAQSQAQSGPLAGLAGILGLGLSASDPSQQAINTQAAGSASATDLHRQIARVRSNPNLNPEEKARRIQRLVRLLTESQRETARTVSAMF